MRVKPSTRASFRVVSSGSAGTAGPGGSTQPVICLGHTDSQVPYQGLSFSHSMAKVYKMCVDSLTPDGRDSGRSRHSLAVTIAVRNARLTDRQNHPDRSRCTRNPAPPHGGAPLAVPNASSQRPVVGWQSVAGHYACSLRALPYAAHAALAVYSQPKSELRCPPLRLLHALPTSPSPSSIGQLFAQMNMWGT